MLRSLKCPKILPILQGFTFTTIASGTRATAPIGYEELAWVAVATDAVEAGSTSTVFAATAHSAKIGDKIEMTSGPQIGYVDIVSATGANSITLTTGLQVAPTTGDTFAITRRIARAAAGKVSPTYKDVFSREGITIVTPSTDIAQGGYGMFDTAHGASAFTAELTNAAGTGDDGTGHVLSVGFESDEEDRIEPYQTVYNRCVAPRLMGFHITSAGALTQGASQADIALASSIHTLSFINDFQRGCVVAASPIAAARKSVKVTTASANQAAIEGYDPVGTAVEDLDMHVLVLGWDAIDVQEGVRRAVQVPQIAPRLEVFRIDGTGTAALDVGEEDGTLTDNGTGDYSVTFKQAFARAPIVVVCGKDNPAQLLAAPTSSGFQVGCFNKATNLAVDDEVYAIVLGYDSDTEV